MFGRNWRENDIKKSNKKSKSSYWCHACESSYTPHVRQHFLALVVFTEISVGYARKRFLHHISVWIRMLRRYNNVDEPLKDLHTHVQGTHRKWQNQQNDVLPVKTQISLGISNLIRVFAVRMKKPWAFSYPMSAQRRLKSDWADAQVGTSLHWAHIILLVLSGCGSNRNGLVQLLKKHTKEISRNSYTSVFSLQPQWFMAKLYVSIYRHFPSNVVTGTL